MKKQFFYLLALVVVIGIGCQKELSFEIGNSPAEGSLQSDVSGDCLPKTVNGIYVAASPLVPTTNTITVTVDVTKTGTYAIGTDTVNGYYFRGIGTFTTLGANVVTLRGNGTPFAQGVNNFVVSFDGTVCDIQVTVLPVGSGPATFTLAGAPGSCTTPVVNGVYAKDVPLTAANTVVLNVNVTVAGTYNVTTTATNGMTFAGSGPLATGPQTITLTGTGTPTTLGANTISVTVGSTVCSFVVTVIAPVTGTLGGGPAACTPSTVNGAYAQTVALSAANTVDVQITTTVVGPYVVTTNTVAGFSFSGSGTSNGATQTITLAGTGTPTASGPQNFTVTFGTSSCTFTVNVAPPASWIPDCSSAFVSGTYQVGQALNSAVHTVDIDVDVTTVGPYNISITQNGITFSDAAVFTTTGIQTITLVGSGTPLAAGVFNFNMPGTTPCTFPITVAPAPTIDWKFNIGTTVYQGSRLSADLVFAAPATVLDYSGDNVAADDFSFSLVDVAGGITNGEQYNTNVAIPTSNLGTFYFIGATLDLEADPLTTPAVNIKFIITSHTIATKTIIGTFSGTALDLNTNTIKTITNGTFTAVYP